MRTGVLQFRELRQSVNGQSSLALYEAHLSERVFAYVYLKPRTCALVWKGSQDLRFNSSLPFEFVDTQFTHMPHSRIEFLARSVPFYGSSMLHKGYQVRKCLVTLFLAGEERLREYDLIDPVVPDKYRTEIVDNQDALTTLLFGRFDYVIEHKNELTKKDQLTSYSLTFERPDYSTVSPEWEWSVSIPRDLKLKTATLKWIARHHRAREMRDMDFDQSLARLSEMIKSQDEPVYS